MQARDVDYRCGETSLRGYLALDENAARKRPGVLVFHEGLGLGEFAMERARREAETLEGAFGERAAGLVESAVTPQRGALEGGVGGQRVNGRETRALSETGARHA